MDYGTLTALTAGTATLAKPVGTQFMFILNMDEAPLLLSFKNQDGNQIGLISLSEATAQDAPGGYIDSLDFPLFFDASSIVLTSTVATAHIGCGQSTRRPTGGPQG